LIGGVLAAIAAVALLVISYFLWRKFKPPHLVKDLDNEITWQWKDFIHNPSHWKERHHHHFKEMASGTAEFKKVQNFFYDKLNGKQFEIKRIEAVFNRNLISNFMTKRDLMIGTAHEVAPEEVELDETPKWEKDAPSSGKEFSLRTWVYDSFVQKKDSFEWNTSSPVTILSTVHDASDKETAEKICDSGFTDLLFKDDGLFGKGVYFSTDAETVPSGTDCIIVSHVLTGDIYPVIGTETKTLHGSPIKRGFNSHYVITDKSGKKAPTKTMDCTFDKIVIPEESQIAPAFIIEVVSKPEMTEVAVD